MCGCPGDGGDVEVNTEEGSDAVVHVVCVDTVRRRGTALARTAAVRSSRSLEVLGRLAARLRRAKRNEYVRDFLPLLEATLGGTSAS